MHIIRAIGIAILTIVIAMISKVMWLLPVKMIDYRFYEHWFTYGGKEITYYLMVLWFVWGSFKMLVVAYHDPEERLLNDLKYTIKLYLMVPIAPLLNFQLKHPLFPSKNEQS